MDLELFSKARVFLVLNAHLRTLWGRRGTENVLVISVRSFNRKVDTMHRKPWSKLSNSTGAEYLTRSEIPHLWWVNYGQHISDGERTKRTLKCPLCLWWVSPGGEGRQPTLPLTSGFKKLEQVLHEFHLICSNKEVVVPVLKLCNTSPRGDFGDTAGWPLQYPVNNQMFSNVFSNTCHLRS